MSITRLEKDRLLHRCSHPLTQRLRTPWYSYCNACLIKNPSVLEMTELEDLRDIEVSRMRKEAQP